MNEKKINLFGGAYTIDDLKKYLPDLSAVGGIRPYTLFDGPERGVFALDVWTGSGMRYTVVPDRGMGICNFSYRGIPLDWSSGTGITSPFLYESEGWKWLRSFHGGLVHTCGLDNVGEPRMDDGVKTDNKSFGGHGRISNTPARELSWKSIEENGSLRMAVSGTCRIASAIETSLTLERTVTSSLGSNSIHIHDTVRNVGFDSTPVMLLYHCNFGFPLLSGESVLDVPAKKAFDWNGAPAADFTSLKEPVDKNEDAVIYPELDADAVSLSLFNPRLGDSGLGVHIRYKKEQLPYLTLWKHFHKRSYVLGIEPGTCRVEGRVKEIAKNRAVFLERDEQLHIDLEVSIFEGR